MQELASNAMQSFDLSGRPAIVTDGGRGVGRATALGLAPAAYNASEATLHMLNKLASDAPSYTTDHVLTSDGGYTLR